MREVNALEPSSCKLLQLPLEVNIAHCEDSDINCKILFPKCTVNVEYNMSGVDAVEVTMTLESLGSSTVELADETTEVETDMYVKLVNYQEEITPAFKLFPFRTVYQFKVLPLIRNPHTLLRTK